MWTAFPITSGVHPDKQTFPHNWPFRILFPIVLFCIPVGVALFHNIHRSYLTSVDGDIVFIYEALRLNGGFPQSYLDHTGYVLFVLLAWWLKLMDLLGLVPLSSLQDMLPINKATFEADFEQLVFAGRYMIAVLSGLFAVAFYHGTRVITRSIAVAAIGSLIFAASKELSLQALMIFTELPSGMFLLFSVITLILALRSQHPMRLAFLAAMFATISMMSKMQVIFPVLFLPVIAVVFSIPSGNKPLQGRVICQIEGLDLTLRFLLAGAFSLLAVHMVGATTVLEGSGGLYQLILGGYVALAIYFVGWMRNIALRHRILMMMTVLSGVSAGLYLHFLYNNIDVVERVVNFVETMFTLGSVSRKVGGAADNLPWVSIISTPLDAILRVVIRRFWDMNLLDHPVDILNWAVLVSILMLIVNGMKVQALRISTFLVMAIGVEVAFSLYKVLPKHLIYIDTWLMFAAILSASYLLPRLSTMVKGGMVVLAGVIFVAEINALTNPDWVDHKRGNISCGISKDYTPLIAEGFKHYCDQN